MCSLARIDQLSVDADTGRGAPDAPFQYVAHAEILCDATYIDGLVLEGEGGVPGNDKKTGGLRQLGDEIFGQPVGKEPLLCFGAHIGERQDGDRGLVRQGKSSGTWYLFARPGNT